MHELIETAMTAHTRPAQFQTRQKSLRRGSKHKVPFLIKMLLTILTGKGKRQSRLSAFSELTNHRARGHWTQSF